MKTCSYRAKVLFKELHRKCTQHGAMSKTVQNPPLELISGQASKGAASKLSSPGGCWLLVMGVGRIRLPLSSGSLGLGCWLSHTTGTKI